MIYSGFGNHFAGSFGQTEPKRRTMEFRPGDDVGKRNWGLRPGETASMWGGRPSLSGGVGLTGANKRDDVKQIETLLGRTGHMDLKPTDGPTGYPGTRLVNGIKIFQKENGLKQDGYIRPEGPTARALSSKAGGDDTSGSDGGKDTSETGAPSQGAGDDKSSDASGSGSVVSGAKTGAGTSAPKTKPLHDFDDVNFKSIKDARGAANKENSRRKSVHDFDGVTFPSDQRKAGEKLADVEYRIEQANAARARKPLETHDFEGVDFDKVKKDREKDPENKRQEEGPKTDIKDELKKIQALKKSYDLLKKYPTLQSWMLRLAERGIVLDETILNEFYWGGGGA